MGGVVSKVVDLDRPLRMWFLPCNSQKWPSLARIGCRMVSAERSVYWLQLIPILFTNDAIIHASATAAMATIPPLALTHP
jgi:hypothetical protein